MWCSLKILLRPTSMLNAIMEERMCLRAVCVVCRFTCLLIQDSLCGVTTSCNSREFMPLSARASAPRNAKKEGSDGSKLLSLDIRGPTNDNEDFVDLLSHDCARHQQLQGMHSLVSGIVDLLDSFVDQAGEEVEGAVRHDGDHEADSPDSLRMREAPSCVFQL
mmetsp:Transcript_16738/g.44907  ORF Transcript_16738/g.44907 Transcript_16738/m.44907 type:complete len:163 (+) Transcript_16738:98-586(+)